MEQATVLPLFPLATVLFPGGRLPLRIFEPRYLTMIGECRESGEPFGVVLIREGEEARRSGASAAPTIWPFGTGAEVLDCQSGPDDTLAVIAGGTERFSVRESWERDDHLLVGAVEWIEPEAARPVGAEHGDLLLVVEQLRNQPAVRQAGLELDPEDAGNIVWRLAEMLPVESTDRQLLLQMNTVAERLDWVLLRFAAMGGGPRALV